MHALLGAGVTAQALVHNDGKPIRWSQRTPATVALPAEALRVLPESNGARHGLDGPE